MGGGLLLQAVLDAGRLSLSGSGKVGGGEASVIGAPSPCVLVTGQHKSIHMLDMGTRGNGEGGVDHVFAPHVSCLFTPCVSPNSFLGERGTAFDDGSVLT